MSHNSYTVCNCRLWPGTLAHTLAGLQIKRAFACWLATCAELLILALGTTLWTRLTMAGLLTAKAARRASRHTHLICIQKPTCNTHRLKHTHVTSIIPITHLASHHCNSHPAIHIISASIYNTFHVIRPNSRASLYRQWQTDGRNIRMNHKREGQTFETCVALIPCSPPAGLTWRVTRITFPII